MDYISATLTDFWSWLRPRPRQNIGDDGVYHLAPNDGPVEMLAIMHNGVLHSPTLDGTLLPALLVIRSDGLFSTVMQVEYHNHGVLHRDCGPAHLYMSQTRHLGADKLAAELSWITNGHYREIHPSNGDRWDEWASIVATDDHFTRAYSVSPVPFGEATEPTRIRYALQEEVVKLIPNCRHLAHIIMEYAARHHISTTPITIDEARRMFPRITADME